MDTLELEEEKKRVLAAVKNDGRELEYASEELKKDREVVFAAVKNDGRALEYAYTELKNDDEIVEAAYINNFDVLLYASDRLRCKIINEQINLSEAYSNASKHFK
jgi:hypothetical protein